MEESKILELYSVETTGIKVLKTFDKVSSEALREALEAFKRKGWVSSSVFYMSGAVHVKLKGKNYGVKSTIEAVAIPEGVKEPQLTEALARLLTQKATK